MATPVLSGTFIFNPSAYYIICRTLRQCGVIATGEVPDPEDAQNAGFALNSLIKAWQGSGIHVWTEGDYTVFLQPKQTSYMLGLGTTDHWTLSSAWSQVSLLLNVAQGDMGFYVAEPLNLAAGWQIGIQMDGGYIFWSTIFDITGTGPYAIGLNTAFPGTATAGDLAFSYTFAPPRPLRIPAGRRYIYGATIDNEIPMVPMSRLDYAAMPNKTTTGAVTQFFYDPQVDPIGAFYCWPTPYDDSLGVKFTGQRPLQDVDVLTNLVDFPKEWLNALTWNLSLELGPEFDVAADRMAIIEKQAERWYGMASTWDRETGSVLFGWANGPQYRTG
jgi:hypothetical protein